MNTVFQMILWNFVEEEHPLAALTLSPLPKNDYGDFKTN